MSSNKPIHSYSPSSSSFQGKFESIIAALKREGVTFDESTIDYFQKLLSSKLATGKSSRQISDPTSSAAVPMDSRLKGLIEQGIDISEYSDDELQTMIEMSPSKEERAQVWSDREMGADSDDHEDETEDSKGDLRKILTSRLRYNTFIVGGGAWQSHWEKKKKPGMAAQMDEITGFDVAMNKPLEPSHDDLKSSIPPELLKRFSTQIIIMEPMKKRDYIELIPEFAAVLPPACRGLFSKLATEQAAHAHKDMIGMRFYEEVLTQTLTADIAPALSDSIKKKNEKTRNR